VYNDGAIYIAIEKKGMTTAKSTLREDVVKNPVYHQMQLQDVLEAAFRRDEALAVEFRKEIKAGKEPETLPERCLLGGAELPAQVQSELRELRPEARIVRAHTDSGAYRGSVIAETTQSLIQRISRQSAVIHQKDDLDRVPRIGEYVCISYTEGLGHVTLVRERSPGKELAH
jgi:hypothetical protein